MELYFKALLTFLEDVKREIEEEGGIATIDEAIERVKSRL